MGINFWGVVHGTRAFLPHLQCQREAHIVNLSSIFGIIAPPGQTAYAASKFAVRGFSESLRHELEMNASPVRLSVVLPGGVATNIARNSRVGARMTDNQRRVQALDRFDQMAQTTSAAAAKRIIEGIEKNEPRILMERTHVGWTCSAAEARLLLGITLRAASRRSGTKKPGAHDGEHGVSRVLSTTDDFKRPSVSWAFRPLPSRYSASRRRSSGRGEGFCRGAPATLASATLGAKGQERVKNSSLGAWRRTAEGPPKAAELAASRER